MGRASAVMILMLLFLVPSVFPQIRSSDTSWPEMVIRYGTLHEMRIVDSEERIVTGLRQADFLVLEEGQPRPVVFLEERESVPVSVAILIDTGSNMSREDILRAKRLAFRLIHALDPNDEILLGIYDREIEFLSPLTTDRYQLLEALNLIGAGGRPSFWSRLGSLFASSAYTGWAVDEAIRELQAATHPVRIVLVISASFGNIGEATEEHLRQNRVRFFAASAGSDPSGPFNLWGDQMARHRIRERTAGVEFSTEGLIDRVYGIRDSMKHLYWIAYEPGDIRKPLAQRKVEIQVRGHPDYKVSLLYLGSTLTSGQPRLPDLKPPSRPHR